MVTVDCEWCGESMERGRAQIQNQTHVFWSRYCKAQFQQSDQWGGADHPLSDRVEVDCTWCDETLRRKPSVVDRRERVFCGYDCMGEWRAQNRTGEKYATEYVSPPLPGAVALDRAEDHLSKNLQRYIERYEEWHRINR